MEKNIYTMNSFNIAITTFSKRFEYITTLIPQIRSFVDNKIFLIINGEKNGNFNEEYRVNVLKLCASYENVFPVFFVETRGLSKLWNTAIIMSEVNDILILNDDISINTNEIFEKTISHINSTIYSGLTKINGSFSHLIVNKPMLDKIGYFDERLLGFGEEDGDITYRLGKEKIPVNQFFTNGVINIVSDIRHDYIKPGIGKYSSFNRNFIYNDKYVPNLSSQHKGMFDTPMDQRLEDKNQYPYESFFMENKEKL